MKILFLSIIAGIILYQIIEPIVRRHRLRMMEQVPIKQLDEWYSFVWKQIQSSYSNEQTARCAELIQLYYQWFYATTPEFMLKNKVNRLWELLADKEFKFIKEEHESGSTLKVAPGGKLTL